jgi:hypothetical protein
MNKKRIRLISIIVAAALAIGVGGVIYAQPPPHTDNGGHKLIGVGEMGYEDFTFSGIPGPTGSYDYAGEIRGWDTQFIITNPNCDDYIDIEWVALIAGEDTSEFNAEQVLWEGTPGDWYYCWPGVAVPEELSPHEVWQVSLAELAYMVDTGSAPSDQELYEFIANTDLNKFTLEVTWTGVNYGGWWGWRDWQGGRPLIGWQKEKCRHMMYGIGFSEMPVEFPGLAISEAPMEVFPGCNDFNAGPWCD